MQIFRTTGALLALSIFVGCADVTTPLTAPETSAPAFAKGQSEGRAVQFVHRAPHTPPFKDEVVSFTVRPGQAGEVVMNFADGSPFVRFAVSSESLKGATINGVAVPEDKELTITLRRIDASRYAIDMQPSGLIFNPEAPAEVTFYYENAAVGDEAVEVIKQHNNGETWLPTPWKDDREARRMRGTVEDFTTFAMSYPSRR